MVQRSNDCKNSPKNAAAEELVILLLTAALEPLSQRLTDDATLEIVGKSSTQGREDILELVGREQEPGLTALRIDHALTHGKVGAVNGLLTTPDGADRGFCVMLEFATTKAERVQQIKLYRP